MCKIILIFLLALPLPLLSQTYITNVTIADVEKEKLLENRTVVIYDGIITAIQSNKTKIPANATIIDGTGKFLFPGMTDAHIHFFQNGGLYTRPDAIDLRHHSSFDKEMALAHQTMEDKLKRYLQNGITNVIDVGASNAFLKQRGELQQNANTPSIFMTGPLITTFQPEIYKDLKDETPFSLVKSIEDGINMVEQQLPLRPDFIKIWYITGADGLSIEESARKNLPIIQAIIAKAHEHKLKVAVHATERITAQLAVESGADFLVHSVDDELLKDDFIQLMKKNKVIVCPTLTVSAGYENTFGQKLSMHDHDLLRADPFQLGSLLDVHHLPDTTMINAYKTWGNSPQQHEISKKRNEISLQNLKKLSDAGIIIATGTDAGNIGTLHASSYLNELMAMQKAGMSNWKIIQASTINGAKVLNKEKEFGSITPGKKANMILFDANPLDSLANITRIHRVINKGIVIDPDTLIAETPAALAQRQLNAYNFRNMEAFLEPYADDVEIYMFPDEMIMKGKDAMRKNYSPYFASTPDLHCELVGRIVRGNVVIDQERVRAKGKYIEAIAIYHIVDNKIKKVYFVE